MMTSHAQALREIKDDFVRFAHRMIDELRKLDTRDGPTAGDPSGPSAGGGVNDERGHRLAYTQKAVDRYLQYKAQKQQKQGQPQNKGLEP